MKSKIVHPDECSTKLAQLETMSAQDLRALWKELIGRQPAANLRRELLTPIVAWKLQERAYGGLKPSTQAHLRKLAASFAAGDFDPRARNTRFKPGTRLIREWRGETHEVTICTSGYEYRGKQFTSLSEIANLITGTRWSGPLFFGTKTTSKRTSK